MTSRPARWALRTIRSALVTGCVILTGCGSTASPLLAEPSPTGSAASSCQAVMAALPQQVAGLARTASTPLTASWGDPAITLRCGVDRPEGLTPTSRCDEVDRVGWYSEEFTEAWRFTTIGRVGYVEVTVPAVHAPASDALVDLAPAVRRMASVHPCQ